MNTLNIDKVDLKLHWKAEFQDSTIISQYENDKENSFKEVKDRLKDLKYFSLNHISKPLTIGVDLTKGLIYFNDAQVAEPDLLGEKVNIRLIYFRRNKIHFNSRFEQIGRDILYFLGYQYIDKQGKNRKVILQITQEGNITIGDI